MASIWDDEPDADNESDLVKQLRAVIKKGKEQNEQYETELKQLRPQIRSTSVTSILTGLKVNPKIAKVIPDSVDANEESVKAWLDEYGDLFGAAPAEETAESAANQNGNDGNETPDVDAETAAAWQRVQTAGSQSGATTPDAETAQLAMLQAAANAAKGNSDLYFSYLRGEVPIPTS